MYEAWFRWNPYQAELRERERLAVMGAVDEVLGDGDRVLEVGAGAGHYTLPVARRCGEVLATDGSAAMLSYLDRRVAREDVPNVRTQVTEIPALEVEPRGFDGALAVGVLNYVQDLDACLDAFRAAVRPGGWVVFTVPLDSFGGRIYRASELISRHRVWLHTPDSVSASAGRNGMSVTRFARAGFTKSGLTLVTLARVAGDGVTGAASV